jgi:hypothetical protein
MPRAYRRPVQPAEIDAKLALFTKLRAEKPSFIEAIKVPLAAILASPNFLYLVEPEAPQAQLRRLTPFELAARLSYFLWSSAPDDELLRLAVSGQIAKPEVMRAEVNRLLADPRSESFVKNFAGQWLGLRKVGANPPSKTLYPDYDRHLEISMVRETEGFFAEILRHDLDARNLIKSDFVTINARLARFYGIPGVKGDAIRRVPAPPESHRGGLVTQASIQSITSNGTRTSPVVRGTWVLKTLLGTDPGLPVANVGEIQPKVPGIDKATVRQRLEIHRQNASCAVSRQDRSTRSRVGKLQCGRRMARPGRARLQRPDRQGRSRDRCERQDARRHRVRWRGGPAAAALEKGGSLPDFARQSTHHLRPRSRARLLRSASGARFHRPNERKSLHAPVIDCRDRDLGRIHHQVTSHESHLPHADFSADCPARPRCLACAADAGGDAPARGACGAVYV